MWHCGVDVANPQLSDWTRSYEAGGSIFSAVTVRGSDELFQNDYGEDLLKIYFPSGKNVS